MALKKGGFRANTSAIAPLQRDTRKCRRAATGAKRRKIAKHAKSLRASSQAISAVAVSHPCRNIGRGTSPRCPTFFRAV